jgi:hypothetical protein
MTLEERPIDRAEGLSPARERKWGLVGGLAGALAGCTCALVAVYLDGASWLESGPYPAIFREPRLLAVDVCLLAFIVVGLGFSVAGLVSVRRSPFPRSEAYGAGLIGALLSVLGGVILFIRLVALTGGG